MSQYEQPTLADPAALRALDARNVRRYSFHFVLVGLAGLVLALLLAVTSLPVALVAGFVALLACVAALLGFVKNHPNVAARFSGLVGTFWAAWAVGAVVAVLGATVWDHNPAAIWGGGLLALLAGLVVGHLVNRSAGGTPDAGADHRVH